MTVTCDEAATNARRVRYGSHLPDQIMLAIACAIGAGLIALLFAGTFNLANGLALAFWSFIFVVTSGAIGLVGVRFAPLAARRPGATLWMRTFPVLHVGWIGVIPMLWVSAAIGVGLLGVSLGILGSGIAVAGWYRWVRPEWEKAGLSSYRRLFSWFMGTAIFTGIASIGWCFVLYVVSFGQS
jgi:hypothetical protein